MLRAVVGRAATRSGGGAGLREPFSATATNPNSSPTAPNSASAKSAASPSSKKRKPHRLNPSRRHLSRSSPPPPPSALNNLPWPAAATSGVIIPTWPPYPSSPQHDDRDREWVFVDGREEGEIAIGYYDDLVLGPVPSQGEVENAVSALQQ